MLRVAFAAGGVAAAVAGALLLPGSPSPPPASTQREGPAQTVAQEREVRLTAADRHAINLLLDRFVPAAVQRRNPALAWSLSGPNLRGSTTRADWIAGRLPVYPYPARDTTFHGWTLDWSTESSVGLDLLLQPRAGATQGAIAFRVVVRRSAGRWIVDYWLPIATFAPTGKKPNITSHVDLAPMPVPAPPSGSLGLAWLLVPLAIIAAAAVLVPTAIGIASWRKGRRLRSSIPAARRELPPLPSGVVRRPPPTDEP